VSAFSVYLFFDGKMIHIFKHIMRCIFFCDKIYESLFFSKIYFCLVCSHLSSLWRLQNWNLSNADLVIKFHQIPLLNFFRIFFFNWRIIWEYIDIEPLFFYAESPLFRPANSKFQKFYMIKHFHILYSAMIFLICTLKMVSQFIEQGARSLILILVKNLYFGETVGFLSKTWI